MKLGVDVRCLQDQYWTGVGWYTWHILNQFRSLSTEVLDVGLFTNALQPSYGGKIDTLGKLYCSRLPSRLLNFLWQYNLGPSLDKILGQHNFRPKIVWLPNLHFFKLSQQVTKAITIHDLSFIHFPQFFSCKKRLWYLSYINKIVRYGLTDFSLILTVSQHTADDLCNLRPDLASKVVSITPGVEENFFTVATSSQIAAIKVKLRIPDNYLLSVATLEPRKNLLLLLKVFDELANHDNSLALVIAGACGWQWKPIIKCWQGMKYKNKVYFVGYISPADKVSLYAGAKMFLYPSYYEGFGFPALEAMAQGVPTLVSSVSSLPEIVQDGAMTLDPWDLDEWLYTIKYLLFNKELLIKLADRGRKVAQNYHWSITANKILSEFNKL